jgi:hypothetical protein
MRKKEIKLMASQKKKSKYKSNDIKYSIATCENNELKNIIELAFASYSKYSIKKKKHSINANVKILKKKPDTSSKHKTSENSGNVDTKNKSPTDKKKILSVICKYRIKNIDAVNSTKRPKKHKSADTSSSSHLEKIPKKETIKIPWIKITANIRCHCLQWLIR